MSFFSNGLYLKNFSIKSTWVNTILRQQYLFNLSWSNASPSVKVSSCNNVRYVSHLSPTTLPHEKQRMGMIMKS